MPNRLNLLALRRRRLPSTPPPEPSLSALATSAPETTVSRRELLGLAGAAAVALPPGAKQLGSGARGPFRFVPQGERLSFALGGRERWVIDASRFAGTPQVRYTQSPDRIAIALSGARYPGTEAPADFACVIRRSLVGWRMRLKHAFGGLEAEVPFEAWLAGAEPLCGDVDAPGVLCVVGESDRLEAGAGRLAFSPDGALRLTGARVARLPGGLSYADAVTIALLAPEADSLLAEPPLRRSLLTLERGEERWPLPALAVPPGTQLAAENPFDRLSLETGERGGALVQALVATANGNEPRLRLAPGGDLRGIDGRPLVLPLANPRYAVAFDASGDEAALLADFHARPTWLSAGGCTLQVGGGPDVEPFELTSRGGALSGVRCEPALLTFAAPLAGAVVGPATPAASVRVSFIAEGEQIAQRPPIRRPPVVRPKPDEEEKPPPERDTPPEPAEPRRPVEARPERVPAGTVLTRPELSIVEMPLGPFTVPVLRRDDLLYLTFQFVNLKLETGAGQAPRLVRAKPNDPTYIIVQFPPQHIGERAFLEESNDEPTPPPVPSILAGPSRLVFEVPKTVTEIPYNLPGLLDWSSFELSVAPTALAPSLPKVARSAALPPARAIARPAPGDLSRAGVVPLDTGAVSPLRVQADPLKLSLDVTPAGVLLRPTLAPNLLGALRPAEPEPTETAIELPYRLLLSPNASAGWLHSRTAVRRNKRVELWHTRLGVKSADGTVREDQYAYGWDNEDFRVLQVAPPSSTYARLHSLRAIWSPDYAKDLPMSDLEVPFRMSLNRRDRCQLVWLMADYSLKECRERVAETKRLMLSALGAWIDARYGYDPLPLGHGLSLEEWQHITAMGRDQYVKVVEVGYLFPFGHRAALVKVTERKFEVAGNSSIAYLRQRFYIVVREPVKTYAAPGQANNGRRMPFRKVTLLTRVTPTLTMTDDVAVPGVAGTTQDCFWARVQGEDFQFSLIGEDWDGEEHAFTAPLVFAGAAGDLCFKRGPMSKLVTEYLKLSDPAADPNTVPIARARRPFYGRKIAFADSEGAKAGDSALESESVTFGAEVDDPAAGLSSDALRLAGQPCFYPTVFSAAVRVPAAVIVTGQNAAVPIKIADIYVKGGWSNAGNRGSVFAEMLDKAPLNFPGDKGGGLALPNLNLGGLSRQFGPVGDDLANFADGKFDPKEFFKGAASTLFGCIDLWEIIAGVFGDAEVPGLTVDVEKDKDGLPRLIRAKYAWTPQVRDFDPLFKAANAGKSATFELNATVEVPVAPGLDVTYDSLARLRNFTIDLYCIVVRFNRLEFTARSGSKPDVGVDIAKVEFAGPLSFVNQLQELLGEVVPGFSIDVTPTGVYIGYQLPLPSVAVGAMSLQNMTLGAALTLPFTGDPLRFRFSFCERENPFLISVSIFGGGGFFAIELTPGGMQMLEASLEFGGTFSLNIGVASGGAYLMAGIYYKWENGDSTLTGYVKCGGHLSVLGLITISAEFYLGLTYESAGNRCWGQAKLTVEIEILFFSFSVTLSVEREFTNSGGGSAFLPTGERLAFLGTPSEIARLGLAPFGQRPPTIEETMTAADWQAYCGAFA